MNETVSAPMKIIAVAEMTATAESTIIAPVAALSIIRETFGSLRGLGDFMHGILRGILAKQIKT